jgi:hypothetical protein
MPPNTNNKPQPAGSTHQAAKDAGFKDFNAFLLSYNLRIECSDDVEEGKAILRAMGYLR